MSHPTDRFTGIERDYGELFSEVFAYQGLDYQALQQSILRAIRAHFADDKTIRILDIGIGDGATSAPLVEADYRDITGIDTNPHMRTAAKEKLGSRVKILDVDATDMRCFQRDSFDVIIAGMAIHNIAIAQRKELWGHLRRLNPTLIVLAEKIADQNGKKHQEAYARECRAIQEIYGKKHGLPEVAQRWIEHYKEDEKNKLTMSEIRVALAIKYSTTIVFEMGMSKTVVAQHI